MDLATHPWNKVGKVNFNTDRTNWKKEKYIYISGHGLITSKQVWSVVYFVLVQVNTPTGTKTLKKIFQFSVSISMYKGTYLVYYRSLYIVMGGIHSSIRHIAHLSTCHLLLLYKHYYFRLTTLRLRMYALIVSCFDSSTSCLMSTSS